MWSSGKHIIYPPGISITVLTVQKLLFIIFCQFNAEDVELGLIHHVWRFAHQIKRTVGCRECDDISDVVRSRQYHDQSFQSDADAAMRRCAVAEGVKEEAESFLRLFHGETDCLEDLFLQVLIMDTDRAGEQLVAVEHKVIGS